MGVAGLGDDGPQPPRTAAVAAMTATMTPTARLGIRTIITALSATSR